MASNVQIDVTDDSIIVTMRKNVELGLSSSRKNMLVATTGGNIDLGDGFKLGLNLYKPVAKGG